MTTQAQLERCTEQLEKARENMEKYNASIAAGDPDNPKEKAVLQEIIDIYQEEMTKSTEMLENAKPATAKICDTNNSGGAQPGAGTASAGSRAIFQAATDNNICDTSNSNTTQSNSGTCNTATGNTAASLHSGPAMLQAPCSQMSVNTKERQNVARGAS